MPEITVTTPGMRAKRRVKRALSTNQDPNPEDVDLIKQEGLEVPELELWLQQKSRHQPEPSVNLNEGQNFQGATEPHLNATLGHELPPVPERKPASRAEREWYDYFAFRFGPLVLLIIWFFSADLEKATFYAPSPDECKTAAGPLSRVAARVEKALNVPDVVHAGFVLSDDITTLGTVCVSYLDRIGALEKIMPYFMGMSSRAKKLGKNYYAKQAGVKLEPSTEQVPTNGVVPPVPGLFEQYRTDV